MLSLPTAAFESKELINDRQLSNKNACSEDALQKLYTVPNRTTDKWILKVQTIPRKWRGANLQKQCRNPLTKRGLLDPVVRAT
jgi:hypothetical protein